MNILLSKRSFCCAGIRTSAGSFCRRKKNERNMRRRMKRTSPHPGNRSRLKWQTAEVWTFLRNRWEQARIGQQRMLAAGKDSSQSPTARCCEVKFELSLRSMAIYLSLNRRAGARLNSPLLSSWQKSTWGTTTCTVWKRKLNFSQEKQLLFYLLSVYNDSR